MTINDEDVDIMIIMHTDGDYGDATHVRIGGGDVKDEQVGPDKSCPLHWMTEWDATYCETAGNGLITIIIGEMMIHTIHDEFWLFQN